MRDDLLNEADRTIKDGDKLLARLNKDLCRKAAIRDVLYSFTCQEIDLRSAHFKLLRN